MIKNRLLLEVAALCTASGLVTCCQAIMPLWIAGTVKGGLLSTIQVGRAGSIELLAIAAGLMLMTVAPQRLNTRFVACVMALGVAIANVATILMVLSFPVMRALSGLLLGILAAIIVPMLACRPQGQRVLAIATTTGMLLVSLIYLAADELHAKLGPTAPFAVMAIIALVSTGILWLGLPHTKTQGAGTEPSIEVTPGRPTLASIAGCLAFSLVALGQNTVFLFIVAIGQGLGFGMATVDRALATALPLSLLAPVVGYLIGERIGLAKPLILGLALLAGDIVSLLYTYRFSSFYLGLVALNLLYTFSAIYATALVGRLDMSGRSVNGLNVLAIGVSAIGPAIGSAILVSEGYRILLLSSAACVLLGVVLFLWIVSRAAGARPAARSKPTAVPKALSAGFWMLQSHLARQTRSVKETPLNPCSRR